MGESDDWGVPGSSAEIYETIFVPAMMGEWPPRVMALAGPRPGEHVLDVACGTGVLTCLLAKTVGPKGRVVGLDFSPNMLAVARKTRPDPSNEAPIDWREGDAAAIPFERETFDIVFCEFGLMAIPDRVAAFKEMRRVLKPNGRLAVSVWGSIDQSPGQKAILESCERHLGADGAALFYKQHVLGDPQALLELVRSAGFREVSVQKTLGAVHLQSPEQLVRSYASMAGLEADDVTRTRIIAEVSAALQAYVAADGLTYPIEAILASARK